MTNSPHSNPALEEWIRQLLLCPTEELNRTYTPSRYDAIRQQVGALPDVGTMNYKSCSVSDLVVRP